MRTLLLMESCFVTFLVLGQVSWAEEFKHPRSADLPASPAFLNPLLNMMTLKTAYLAPLNKPVSPKDILLEAEDRLTRSFLATSSLFQGNLMGEGELAYSPPDLQSVNKVPDAQYRLLRLALNGTQGRLRYGINYRTAGKYFINTPDQAMREVWGEWSVGIARFRSSLTETQNNLDKEPDRSRVTQMQERISLMIAPPSWAEVGLSYTRSSSSSSLEPKAVAPQRTQLDTLEGTVTYNGSTWQARFSSTYSLNMDRLRPGGETVGLAHALSGSYRPTKTLTFVPSVTFREDRQGWSGIHTETRSGSLSLTYAPDAIFSLTTLGSYNKTHSNDGLIDLSTYNAKGIFTWTYQATQFRKSISFEAGYAHSLDMINRALSTKDISGLLRIQLAWF